MVTTRRKPTRKPAKPKAKKQKSTDRVMLMRLNPRARSARRKRQAQEVVGIRCRVTALHPEAEALMLQEHLYGREFILPLSSAPKDGRYVKELARLHGRTVWLSLRLL
jgi:hypothetical protein